MLNISKDGVCVVLGYFEGEMSKPKNGVSKKPVSFEFSLKTQVNC